MIPTWLLVVVFVIGVACGATLREAWNLARYGHDGAMPPALTVRRPSPRRVLVWALTIALVVNALLGFLLITARAATEREAASRDDLVTCLADYNARLGQALNDRDAAIRSAAGSEIRLWAKYGELYHRAKSDPKSIPAVQDELASEIATHHDDLVRTQNTRAANPYPPADLCGPTSRK